MGLTGDFATLDDWQSGIAALAEPASIAEVSAELAGDTLRRTDEQFERERDPFGKPWARKKYPDGRKVGQGKTGRLRSTYRVKSVSRFGFTIGAEMQYRIWFHGGKRNQAPRNLSPGSRLPPAWSRGYDGIWQGHCRQKLGLR